MKTTVIKKVEWKSNNGSDIIVEVKLTKELKKEKINADGHIVKTKGKITRDKSITLKANGKEIVTLENANPQIVTEKKFPSEFVESVKAAGTYAHIENGVTINEENYNLVMKAIEEAEEEIKVKFAEENKKEVKVEKEEQEKEITAKVEWAHKVIREAKTRKVLSRTEEKKWRENYNNLHNEGGDGYIPNRITLEDVERAKSIIE